MPSHEATYLRLRNMVLTGGLVPGQAVTIQGLTAVLDAGMTPVREAIRRLTAEGALQLHGNRRVSVPLLNEAQLDQIAFARLTVEPHLAGLAAGRLTDGRIAKLTAIDRAIEDALTTHDIPAYLEGNHHFHFLLYDAAEAQILTDIAQSLWLRFGPSLRVVTDRFRRLGLPDRHSEALAAMQARDAAALSRAIRSDIEQGVELVRSALPGAGVQPPQG